MLKLSKKLFLLFLLFSFIFVTTHFKSHAEKTELTLEWISKASYKNIGRSPSSIHWSEDGKRIYFLWNPEKEKSSSLYWLPLEGGKPTKVPEEERWKLPEGRGDRNDQGTYTVYQKFGDIFLLNIKTDKAKRIFKTEKSESNPRFLKDGKRFTFEMDRNLHLYDINSGTITQLTDIRSDKDPEKKPEKSKEQEYLKKQQEDLFDIVKRRIEDRERSKKKIKKQNPKPEPLYLGSKKKRVVSYVPSPCGKYVGIVVMDSSKNDQGRLPIMPKNVTDSGYVETQELDFRRFKRVKVGAPVASYRNGVYEVKTGEVTWADVEIKDREVSHNAPVWADDSSKFAFVIGSLDNKDRWIAVFDIAERKAEIVDHERDEAWIRDLRAGRGGYSFMAWLKDNDTLCYLSERDKWWHLYACKVSSKKVNQLTKGEWEISYINLSKDKTKFYVTTTEVHPGERHLYSLPEEGGKLTRLTTREGWHRPYFSPDEKNIALSFSDGNTPSELHIMPNSPRAKMKRLTDSTTPEFKSLALPKPQLITFPDADGNLIYGDLYLPEETAVKRPAVLYIHGAGYAQAVYKLWSNRRLMHHYLVQNGYVVLSIDYRGSAGYGRDCRTAIYRHMGGKDVDSAVAAVEYLVKNHNVDRKRIGLYGGSYGGFYTLMALFTHPGVFAAGVARVPVTDWAHYNHGYTSRILNLPYDDEEAYKRSSPIYFADGLQDHLLIVDGIEDNNVLVQDTMRLVQRLIELGKDNWSCQLYPIESHGLGQESSRLDYNKRMTRFFDRHLKRQ